MSFDGTSELCLLYHCICLEQHGLDTISLLKDIKTLFFTQAVGHGVHLSDLFVMDAMDV